MKFLYFQEVRRREASGVSANPLFVHPTRYQCLFCLWVDTCG